MALISASFIQLVRTLATGAAVLAMLIAPEAHAVWANFLETPDIFSLEGINRWKFPDQILIKDSGGNYTLDFHEQEPNNQKLVKALAYLDFEVAKHRIAAELMKFSSECDLNNLGFNAKIAPIPEISHKSSGVADPRRISAFYVVGCVDPTPEECKYNAAKDGSTGLDLSDIIWRIRGCLIATERAKKKSKTEGAFQ